MQYIFQKALIILRICELFILNALDKFFLCRFFPQIWMLQLLANSDGAADPAVGANGILGMPRAALLEFLA